MYKRIAVAIDGSKTSDLALEEAIKLAAEMGSTLMLLHVCEELPFMWEPDGMNAVPMQDIMKAITDAGNALLEKCKERVASQGVGPACQRELRAADAVAVATDERAEIRTAFHIGRVHVTIQRVEAEHDVGEFAVFVRHAQRLDDAAVGHDARLGALGVAQRVDFNRFAVRHLAEISLGDGGI